jgi:hypothetical protein
MKTRYPQRKLGLVTFSDEVEIIGDGTTPSVLIGRENNNNYDFIMKSGVSCASA